MKRFVLGDIHGEHDKLMQVLKASGIDYENDLLIQIGDLVDRGPEPFLCIDELLKFRHKVFIKGNHEPSLINEIGRGCRAIPRGGTRAGRRAFHHDPAGTSAKTAF